MDKFIQLHILTSFPPANLNRDDLGRPKTAKMGGVDRLRVSSQSLKRAWRTSTVFQTALSGHIGDRTKNLGCKVYEKFIEKGIEEEKAKEWAKKIAGCFGKLKPADPNNRNARKELEIEQLAHISPEEWNRVNELCEALIIQKRPPRDDELDLLRVPESAADIALFGRMLTKDTSDRNITKYGQEASCQVAHAISVHPVVIEDDYFTAVDDLNTGEEDVGAGHIGEAGFASALFYIYVCIDREQLLENLGGNTELANKTLGALLEAALTVSPTGKQNSFASRAYASYVLVEKGSIQPRSLSVAFLKPIRGENFGEDAYKALEKTYTQIDNAYEIEIKDIKRKSLNVFTGEGKLSDLIQFIQE